MEGAHPALTLVLALAVGIVCQSAARHLRIPGIVLLLIAGVALGPDGLDWVRPSELGAGLVHIVYLAVAVILFEGGLNLDISRLRHEQVAIRRLVTLGALVTTIGGALAVHALFDWPWVLALLFGSLVAVTGPTVVGPLLETLRLRPRVATVLEAEGVLIDPIGAILSVLLLEFALAPVAGAMATQATALLMRLGFGLIAGAAGGFALAGLLRARRLVPEGHENVFVLAAVLLLSEGCDTLVSHSGILAVTVAGVVVGNLRTRVDRDLREFKDQLTVLMIGLLFVLLAADVRIEDVRALGWRGLAVVGVLLAAVRPVNVWLATASSELTGRERWFIASVAPRGIVAAAIASVSAGALTAAGLYGGSELRALVFLTIAVTVVVAGLTSLPLASWLDLRLPGRDTVAILGAQGIGLALAKELRAWGSPVIFLDSNPRHCRQAEEAGFPVVFGDAVQERTLQRARFGEVGTAIGLTSNQMLNSVFVSRARERFRVPQGYVAAARPDAGLASELVESDGIDVLFDGPRDVERWDVRSRHGALEMEYWVFGEPEPGDGSAPPPTSPAGGDRFLVLALRRGSKVKPMHLGLAPQAGDVAAVAVHVPERAEAHGALRALGWNPVPEPETQPA